MFYANRRATVKTAYDHCFYSLYALKALKEPDRDRWDGFFDRELDPAASKLAEMCLTYPNLIGREHYNLLVGVRDYREKHGRHRASNTYITPLEVDRSVIEAIAFLESVHDTNVWGKYQFDFDQNGSVTIQRGK